MKEITLINPNCDRSKWGDGPWRDEPDKVQWTDKETGLPCLAVRNYRIGHWCGYVGVQKSNPLFGKDYDSVDVYGGLTYSNKCNGDEYGICHTAELHEDDVWWFGFDFAHSGDLSPALEAMYPSHGTNTYKNLDYVKSECADLAGQLKALECH